MHLTVLKLSLLFIISGCVTKPVDKLDTGNTSLKTLRKTSMSKSGSRIPAPTVQAISYNGIKYEQIKNGLLEDLGQMGGYLAAYDENNGDRLWILKIYDNKRNEEREGDVQDVFFKSMQMHEDGFLKIENEKGKRFLVDLDKKTITPE
jgi:hypothetical protein